MNLLYFTTDKLCSTVGGTERATLNIARILYKRYGVNCYSIYERWASSEKEECIQKEFRWRVSKDEQDNCMFIREIILNYKINCIIVQGAFIHVKRFRNAIDNLSCRLIFAHHFSPGWEVSFFKFSQILRQHPCTVRGFARWMFNLCFYPIISKKYNNYLSLQYKEAYENADNVVLLSNAFIKGFMEFGDVRDSKKFKIIPNSLSFDEYFQINHFGCKKRVVLIVSRMEENAKRLSKALNIWKAVKRMQESQGWVLKLIGEGEDKLFYENKVKKERIPDVYFEGRQNPIPYYREASILMMTSISESWGLTLTEAQQMGVVPIAFDTYKSLRDIITDDYNGVIVPPDNNELYKISIIRLMINYNYRYRLARNGLESCKRFTPIKICNQWIELINASY